MLCPACGGIASVFWCFSFSTLLPSSFQGEATPLHLVVDWPWRHRKHPLSAQEEVSVIASVCLFFWFEGTRKSNYKVFNLLGIHELFHAPREPWVFEPNPQTIHFAMALDSVIHRLSSLNVVLQEPFSLLLLSGNVICRNPSVVPQYQKLSQSSPFYISTTSIDWQDIQIYCVRCCQLFIHGIGETWVSSGSISSSKQTRSGSGQWLFLSESERL